MQKMRRKSFFYTRFELLGWEICGNDGRKNSSVYLPHLPSFLSSLRLFAAVVVEVVLVVGVVAVIVVIIFLMLILFCSVGCPWSRRVPLGQFR